MKTRANYVGRRENRRRWRQGLPLVGGLLVLSGCATPESVRESVYSSRQKAHEQWAAQRGAERNALPELSGRLTLEDAIKVALTYNKPLQAVMQDRDVARGQVLESYGEALPKVSAAADYTRLDEVSGFNVGGQNVSLGQLDNYSADLTVRQPIFRGGAIDAALQSARLYEYLTEESVREQVQATIFEVANAYNSALLAQHLLDVYREAVRSAEAHLRDVEKKLGQGLASRFDVLRAEVDVSNFKAEMIQQQNRLNLARTRLWKVMGVSQETDVALAGELMYEAVEPVFEDVVRVAHLNRPDLYRAELAVRLQEQAVRVARSAYWPRLDATFTQGWARPDPHASTKDEWGDSWVAGVELELPLFDGLARKGRLVQERAILERRRIERKDAEERVLLDIQQALLALRDAAEFVESQRLNLDRAQEGLRLAEVGYQQGIHTEVAIADARAALTQARGLYYQSIYDHTSARIALQRAMGVLGPGREDAGLAAPGMDNIPNAADLTPNDTHVEPIPPKAGEHEEDAE